MQSARAQLESLRSSSHSHVPSASRQHAAKRLQVRAPFASSIYGVGRRLETPTDVPPVGVICPDRMSGRLRVNSNTQQCKITRQGSGVARISNVGLSNPPRALWQTLRKLAQATRFVPVSANAQAEGPRASPGCTAAR